MIGAGLICRLRVSSGHSPVHHGLSGLLIIMVMRMLAEMAVSTRPPGRSADYARTALGDWAGFSVGWLYLVLLGDRRRLRGDRRRQDHPVLGARRPCCGLLLLIAMTADQPVLGVLVRRIEYWFAKIKVGAIVAVLVIDRSTCSACGRTRTWTSPTCGRTAGFSRTASARSLSAW